MAVDPTEPAVVHSRCVEPRSPPPAPFVAAATQCRRKRTTSNEWIPMTSSRAVGELLELVAALDWRVPQVQRAGESAIARDAAALKARALKRIEQLEREACDADV